MAPSESRNPILVGYSPDSATVEPIEFGLAASRVTGAPLIVVAVRKGGAGDDQLRSDLQARGIEGVEVREIDEKSVAHGLSRAVEELRPELLVLGSQPRGAVGSALVGGTAEQVIHESPCPVAVVPNGYQRPEEGVRVVGAAFAPTPEGREALHAAATFARGSGAKLKAIAVLDPKHAEEQSTGLMADQHRDTDISGVTAARGRLGAEEELRAAVAELAAGVDVEIDVLVNEPAEGLIAASRFVDLLVMGSRGQGARRAVLFGSVSRKVADGAACPVLILPRDAAEAAEALASGAAADPG